METKLDEYEKTLLGTAMMACCALHPECTASDKCIEIRRKLGIENYGAIMLSDYIFDRAKRAYLERLSRRTREAPKEIVNVTGDWNSIVTIHITRHSSINVRSAASPIN